MWECQNVTSVLSFLTHECDNHLLYSDGAFEYCFTKAGFYVSFFVKWQFNEVFTFFLFLLLLWKCIFTVHCTHSLISITISKLLLLHLLRCSTRSCSWLVFTNAAGIVQQRVRPSPFRTAPPGLKEWIFFFFFWKLGPVWDCYWEQRYREQLNHCTIMRRSQCLTPHHLETVARSLTWERNRSWSNVLDQLRVRTGHISFLWFGTSPFHICTVPLYTVKEGLKPHTGCLVCFSPITTYSSGV